MTFWRRGFHRAVVAALAAGTVLAAGAPSGRPAAADVGEARTVAYIGDSMGVQAEPQVVAALASTRRVTHVAVANGATIRDTVDEARSIVADDDRPSILVVTLGHADLNLLIRPRRLERHLRAFLDVVSPAVECVRWFDVKPGRTLYPNVNRRAAGWNRQLRRVVAGYPNVEVMHYSTWAAAALPPLWHPDRLHLSRRGRGVFGEMVAQAADGCDPDRSSGPWWDVRDDHWAAGAIAWLGEAEPRAGYGTGTYRARIGRMDLRLKRVQAVTDLWRLAGSPRGLPRGTWVDVPANRLDAFTWADHEGLLESPGTRARPTDPVSRAALVQALWVRAGRPQPVGPPPWPDVPADLADAFAWAHETGLLTLETGQAIRPDAPADRALWAHGLAPPDRRGPLAASPQPAGGTEAAPVRVPVDIEGEPTLVAPG